jgi:type IV pilus assembly protein PilA
VASVSTSNAGVITVTTQGFGDTDIDGKKIVLTPFANATTAMATTDAGKSVYKWICGPAATDGVPPKFLPGSCRGA